MSEDRNESTKRNISRRQFVLGDYIKVTKNIKKNKNVLTEGEDALVKQNASPNNNISFEADSKIGNKYVPPHRRLQYAANRETKTTFESQPGNRDMFKFKRRECQNSDYEYFSKRESKGDPERSNNLRGRRRYQTFGSNNTSCTKTEGLTKYHPSVCKSPEYNGLNELIWFQNLSTMQPTEVLLTIASRRLEIEKMFTNTLPSELLDVFLKFLVKLCQTDFTLNETCIAVLSCSCQEHFLDQLSKHVLYLVASRKMVENVNQMLNDYILYMETIMSLFPQKISNTLEQIVTVNDMLMQFYESYDVLHCDTRIKEKFQNVKDHCQKQKMSQKKLEKEKSRNVDNVIEFNTEIINSEEFRKINIFPEIDDILGKRKYLIKPNIVNGAYDNVEHYLSIQFHLLREDFYSPLREGISDYLTSEIKLSRVNNVRIFKNVTFLMPIIFRTQIGYLINFGSNIRMSKMTWEDSKWFMYGSLLIFTSDNFNTVIFGTVIDSNAALLEKGLLIVSLKDIEIHDALFNREFLLMESEAYFEPYLQVLKVLQSLNENNFPMEKYVVHVKTDISPPKYLCENRSVRMEIDEYEFSVLDDSSWPSSEDLKLDSSQHNALRNALTRELAVIQGPPGTGKTFLGLKVAQVLINNSKIWNSNNQPILVVCYTNHALDQFISGLIPVTNRIVRIGAQSKNKELENFNLKLQSKGFRKNDGTSVLLQTLYNIRCELIAVMEKMNDFLVKIAQHKGIVSYASLKKYGIVENDNNYFETCYYKFTEELFIEWLSYGMHDDTAMCEVQKIRSKNIPDEVRKFQNMETSKSDSLIFWKMLFTNIYVSDKFSHYLKYQIPCGCGSHYEDEIDEMLSYDKMVERDFYVCINCRRKISISKNVRYLEDYDPQLYDKLLYAIHLKELIDDDKPSELAFDIDIHESRLRMMEDEIYQFQNKKFSEKVSRLKMHADAMKSQIKYIKKQLHHEEVLDNDVDAINGMLKRGNLLDLQAKERWTLYRYWEKNLKVRLLEELYRWEKHLQEINRLYGETELISEMSAMKSSLVVGMTTTGAARLQNVIKNLQPAIVIVEEAAEVMESHILASLTKECQHLILIGDHKQLRPSPAEYKLARDYNFDISLFERMINNGIPCDMLKLQHRMRPEISQLITPTIYPGLQNHSSVLKFEKIKGMLKSMFFFTHNYWEEKIEDSHSIRNIPEGNLVLGLCCYLVQQGEQASKITILATYAGQMFYLQKEQKKYSILKNVQITVVDNFQGEENDIILLSLVRSNKDAKIGFLKTENRVCVALSRARKGLYMFGNMNNLTKSSTIWPKIKEILESQEAIDSFITLRCQVHVSEFTTIRSLTDFSKVPNGCCTLICDDDLKCGHKCKQSCHLVDREHENYKCSFPCTRLCDRNHKCMKICWEDCGDCKVHVDKSFPCGHTMSDECWKTRNCMALVDTILPLCGHEVKKPCYLKPEEFICTEPCEYRPLCGHSCVLNCHKSDDPDHLKYQCKKKCANFNKNCKEGHKCEKMCFEKCDNCVVLVQRTLSGCGHEAHIPCAEDPESYNCKANCEKILPCGHPCPLLCYENCGGCPVQVTVQLTDCQHTLEEVKCCEKDNIDCLKPCEKKLLCGHTCAGLCSEACTEMCMELVVSKVTPICGHVIEIPCYLQSEVCPESESILTRCQMPCEAILDCEHQCRGTCAGCRQGQVHQSCDERCEKILVCGHRCKLRCSDTCQPCTNRCLNSCEHMRCSRECGFPCIQCKEPCSWVCPHKKCTKLCSDICDRQPCNEACDKLLACLHPCIGFCGEPCPPFCSICNESDITEILGIKDNSSLRFVYLEDCGHTIEVKELENWLSASCREINFKRCPKCELPIIKTRRYRNDVKRTFQHINLVKNNVHKALQEVESSQKDLIEELCLNYSKVIGLYEDFEEYKETYKMIKRKQESSFNLTDIISLTNLITVFVELSKYFSSYFHSFDEDSRLNLITLINKVLFSLRKLNYIGQKQLNDLNSELLRVHRLGDLISTKNNASKLMDKLLSREENEFKKVQLGIYFKSEIKKHYDAAYKIILSTQKFSKENDSKVCTSLKNLNLFDKTVEVVLGLEMISTYCTNDKFQEAENDENDQTICTTVDTDINIFNENVNSMLSELNKIIEMNKNITFIVKEICTKLKFLREKIDSEKIKMVNFLHRVKDITNDNEFNAFSKHYKVLKNGVHQLMLSLTGLKTLHHQDYNPMLYELSDELNDAKNISQSPLRNGDRDSEFLERQEMKVTMVSDDRHFSTKAETLPNIFEDERTLSTTTRKNEDGQEMIEGESMDMHKLEINCTLEKLSKAISTYLEIETQEKEKLEIKHTTDKLINSNILEIVKNAKLFQMYLNKVIKFVYGKSSVTKTEWEMYLHKALDIRRFIYLLVIERKQCLQHELVNLNEKLDFISTFYNWLQTFMDNPNAIEVIIDHELAQIAMLLAEINELELQNMPSKEKQNLQKTVMLVSHRLEIIRGKKTEISLVSGLRKELQCLLENISTNYFKLNKFESNFKKLTDIINKMSFIELIQNLCLGKVDVSYRCADLRCNIKKCSQKLEKMPFSDSSDLVKPYQIKMKETLRVLNARMNKVKSVDSKTDLTVKVNGLGSLINELADSKITQNKHIAQDYIFSKHIMSNMKQSFSLGYWYACPNGHVYIPEGNSSQEECCCNMCGL